MTLYLEKANVAVILATFAFTMLGFLAAVITILFSLTQSEFFKKFKAKGYLDNFFYIYYVTIFSLLITFSASLLSLAGQNGEISMLVALGSVVNNLVQIFVLTVIIVNLCRKSS